MAQGVMMDGVYATPTLTRNPIAAGIETGVQVGLEQMNRANFQAHDVRMAKLRGAISKANALSIHSATTDEIDYTGYEQGDAVPVKFGFQDFTVPLEIAKRLRIAPNDYVELGVIQELFGEASGVIAELAQSGIKHQYGIYGPELLGSVNDKKYQNKGSQITVNPIEQQGWSNEWRHHVDRALQ